MLSLKESLELEANILDQQLTALEQHHNHNPGLFSHAPYLKLLRHHTTCVYTLHEMHIESQLSQLNTAF